MLGGAMRGKYLIVIAALWLVWLPGASSAQQGSGMAGTVKDASGGVLPGVTVEASSPALIEKTRTAVTDAAGEYEIDYLVLTRGVGDGRPRFFDQRGTRRFHRHARQHAPTRVLDGAGHAAALLSRRGSRQPHEPQCRDYD